MEIIHYRIIRLILLLPITLYAIAGIFIGCFLFTFCNQLPNLPSERQLTVINYLLPMVLTVGFMIYQTFRNPYLEKEKSKHRWFVSLIILGSGMIAIPWQVKHLMWEAQSINFEILIFIIPLVMTMWILIDEIKIIWNRSLKDKIIK